MSRSLSLPVTPSQNQMLRMHWTTRRKKQRELDLLVLAETWGWPKPLPPSHFAVIRRTTGKAPDPDNLPATCKLIFDALQHNGIIEDDSPEFVSLEITWERAKKKAEQGVFITITNK